MSGGMDPRMAQRAADALDTAVHGSGRERVEEPLALGIEVGAAALGGPAAGQAAAFVSRPIAKALVGLAIVGMLAFLMAFTVTLSVLASLDEDQAALTQEGTCRADLPNNAGPLPEQKIRYAEAAISVAQEEGVGMDGAIIGIAAGMAESGLTNYSNEAVPASVDHPAADRLPWNTGTDGDGLLGDFTSVGILQQQNWWGSVDQRLNPREAFRLFYTGGAATADSGSEPGLADIPDWRGMDPGDAAQAVQGSAVPDAYEQYVPMATRLVESLAGAPIPCTGGGAMSCPPTRNAAETGLTPDALRVLRCAREKQGITSFVGVYPGSVAGSDHPSGRGVDLMIPNYDTPRGNAHGWEVARWAKDNAKALGVKYLIFDARIWSAARSAEGWRPYTHASGSNSDTYAHRDHVHVSVYGDAARADTSQEWVLPVPPGSYGITNEYGVQAAYYASGAHTGLDFDTGEGETVRAAAYGRVVYAGDGGAYGNLTKIAHGRGVVTYYAHQQEINVRVGQKVRAGAPIGRVGSTGNSFGAHLHFEVRVDGSLRDPAQWLVQHGVGEGEVT